jgi:hypothetical protein
MRVDSPNDINVVPHRCDPTGALINVLSEKS